METGYSINERRFVDRDSSAAREPVSTSNNALYRHSPPRRSPSAWPSARGRRSHRPALRTACIYPSRWRSGSISLSNGMPPCSRWRADQCALQCDPPCSRLSTREWLPSTIRGAPAADIRSAAEIPAPSIPLGSTPISGLWRSSVLAVVVGQGGALVSLLRLARRSGRSFAFCFLLFEGT